MGALLTEFIFCLDGGICYLFVNSTETNFRCLISISKVILSEHIINQSIKIFSSTLPENTYQ